MLVQKLITTRLNAFLQLTFFFCLLLLTSPGLAIDLPNGGVVAGEISVIGEIDEFTFTADAGDTVFIRVADTETTQFINSAFAPRIELVNPNGVLIVGSGGALVGAIQQFLVVSGEYTVRVRDESPGANNETGTYNLYFANAPGANDDGLLPNGGVVSDVVELGDIDSYTFDASAGETVYIRIADTETTGFFPRIVLVDPSGAVLNTNSGALVGAITRALVVTGTYTVIVTDGSPGDDDQTGSYNLYFAKAPGANDDGVLPNGGVVSDAIDLGDIDSYTFDASAGETVYIRVADTETTEFIPSGFTPGIVLLDPSGAVLSSNSGALVGAISRSLVVGGTYTVIVIDSSPGDDDQSGSYDLYFAKAPGANDDGVLPNGGVVSDAIDLGDIDSYTFDASAGETVYIRVADTETTEFIPSGFTPGIVLLDPSGAVLSSNSGALVGAISRSLVVGGTYTVIVIDSSPGDDDQSGSYDLYFAKAPGANDDGCIANGQSSNGTIDLGDIDSYSFLANVGTSLLVTVSDLDDGPLAPQVILLGPAGNTITSDSDASTAQISTNLNTTGEFTLIVVDGSPGDDDATGNYRIDISGDSVVCPTLQCNGLPITVFIDNGDLPSSSADVILGTNGADTIDALGGNDTICGLGGNDIINGGGGSDWIDGGNGDDDILGSGSDDTIFGGNGDDIIRGGGGNDDIEGEAGDDSLLGQSGNDTLDGGDGVDDINGGPGSDTIYTGSGATANTGIVTSGGSGADVINGGPDADALLGSNGSDTINGFGGNDVITGGNGQDEIDGGDGDDDIRGQGARDILNGGAGDDIINGGAQDDTINGGSGDDDLNGGSGDDTVRGDAGADMVAGGSGDDSLVGGASGGDVCNGQSGVDSAVGSCETLIGVEE